MSEVQSRGQSSRGRGSFRGGRGGYRGTRGGAKPHSRSEEQDNTPSLEEQGEVGELKAKYADKLPLLREVCEGWSDEDLVFALQETEGDVELALDRITTGTISQWGEVKKKQSKTKEVGTPSSDSNTRGRGRGSFEGRGRGRAAERGARASRGGRGASQTNGTKSTEKAGKTTEEAFGDMTGPTPTVDSKATNGDTTAAANEWANEPGKDQLASLATDEPKPASNAAPSTSKSKGWAGLFAKPTPPPAPKKASTPSPPPPASVPVAEPEEPAPVPAPVSAPISVPTTAPVAVPVAVPVPTVEEPPNEPSTPNVESEPIEDTSSDMPSVAAPDSPAVDLPPSQDKLTEKNLDKLPDTSHPPQSITVISTTASTQDPMNPAIPTAPAIRPGMSGFAATALKATTSTGRSASYSRKLMEQQEAVVMPGNHAVDRAAVQFGKMGLSEGEDIDADEDREEPETRTQLPDDSPAAPRASLPPAVPETKAPIEAATEEPAATRPAPGLPPAPQQPSSPPQAASYTDQYRYNQQGQKAYDPFTQQPQSQAAGSEPFSNQVPSQAQGTPGSGQDYSQYYAGNREAYQQYYGHGYGQMHDSQRSASGFGTSAQESQAQYATARPQQGFSQSSDAPNSGNNTPNPTAATHQGQTSQHVPSQGSYGGHPYGYPNAYNQAYQGYGQSYMGNMNHRYGANRPMFDDVRRESDYYGGNQYSYGHNQQYGSNYKSNMYGQPQHPYSHDYSSSPANTASFGGREAGYGRAGSTQPSEGQQNTSTGNNAFGSMPDPFGRTPSGFGQSQGHSTHQGSEEQSKASGPSPSLQGGRPGSALNNMSGQQGSLPHPQSQHSNQGFGGYQQYGGFGNQSHQNSGYGSYGSNTGFGGYGYGGGRGGWSGYGSGQH